MAKRPRVVRNAAATTVAAAPQLVMGRSPSDLVDLVLVEIDSTLKQAGGNRVRAVKLGLRRMHADGLITDRDLERLLRMSRVIFAGDLGKRQPKAVVKELDEIYREMVADIESSSTAIAMVGVSYSKSADRAVGAGGVFGTVVGVLVGGVVGQPGLGGLVGGLVGGWAAALCEEEEEDT
jgi:hypothetical protein